MELNTEHKVMLTTDHCAALLAAANGVLDKYKEAERENEARDSLQEAVDRITDGMGLSKSRAAQLLHFMSTGER